MSYKQMYDVVLKRKHFIRNRIWFSVTKFHCF